MEEDRTGDLSDGKAIAAAAEVLWEATQRRQSVEPIRDVVGTATNVDVAYRIQEINTTRRIARGDRIAGRKVGLTSRTVQAQIGIDQPDFGTLFADMEYGDGAEIDRRSLIQPRAEAEIALVIGADMDDPPHGFVDLIRKVEFALPAIEIVDSRIRDWDISIVDTIADNASCGAYVLGSRPVALHSYDLQQVRMSLNVDGTLRSEGSGQQCLGNPLLAARWAADTLAIRQIPLRAGDVVLTGALGPIVAVGAGQVIDVDFGPFGRVTASLTQDG